MKQTPVVKGAGRNCTAHCPCGGLHHAGLTRNRARLEIRRHRCLDADLQRRNRLRAELQVLTVRRLRQLAADVKITGHSRMTKPELVEALSQ